MSLRYSIKEWGVLVFSIVLPVGKDSKDSLLIIIGL